MLGFGPTPSSSLAGNRPAEEVRAFASVGDGGCEQQNQEGREKAQAGNRNERNVKVDLGKKAKTSCSG